MRVLLLALLRGYKRWISPLLGPRCRFYPSCSSYAMACIEAHGSARGTLLSFIRVCKCHPLHPGGFDPPPPVRQAPLDAGDGGDDLRRAAPSLLLSRPAASFPPDVSLVNRAADGPK